MGRNTHPTHQKEHQAPGWLHNLVVSVQCTINLALIGQGGDSQLVFKILISYLLHRLLYLLETLVVAELDWNSCKSY